MLALLLMLAGTTYAQVDSTHRDKGSIFGDPRLAHYRKAADEYYAAFKNRYALEQLKAMDMAADTLAAVELQKSEKALKYKQETETSEQTTKLTDQAFRIKLLEDHNEVLRNARNSLWKKALLSILIWLIMVGLFVAYRQRMFAMTNKVLAESRQALEISERFYSKGESLRQKVGTNEAALSEARQLSEELTLQLQQQGNAGEQLMPALQAVKGAALANHTLHLLTAEMPDEKQAVDVNALCEQMVLIGNSGIETEDGIYHFTITKDFEKKLPQVKTNEQGLARVLLFLISNALNACYRQSKSGVKAYQPKVTVSTRVLPRFVQVKVKDNGAGVLDNISEEIFDPYFTTEMGKKAGLGLTLCRKIITENKGELKIESALDRGTDVTIKLFTS